MLKVKVACLCTLPGWEEISSRFSYFGRCDFCHGKKYMVHSVEFEDYKGNFKDIDWDKTEVKEHEVYISLKCECGEEVHFSEGWGIKACSCGRVYKMLTKYSVDETHLGDISFLVEEYAKEQNERNRRYKLDEKHITRILGVTDEEW